MTSCSPSEFSYRSGAIQYISVRPCISYSSNARYIPATRTLRNSTCPPIFRSEKRIQNRARDFFDFFCFVGLRRAIARGPASNVRLPLGRDFSTLAHAIRNARAQFGRRSRDIFRRSHLRFAPLGRRSGEVFRSSHMRLLMFGRSSGVIFRRIARLGRRTG